MAEIARGGRGAARGQCERKTAHGAEPVAVRPSGAWRTSRGSEPAAGRLRALSRTKGCVTARDPGARRHAWSPATTCCSDMRNHSTVITFQHSRAAATRGTWMPSGGGWSPSRSEPATRSPSSTGSSSSSEY